MNYNDLVEQNKMMNKIMISTFVVLIILLALIGLQF